MLMLWRMPVCSRGKPPPVCQAFSELALAFLASPAFSGLAPEPSVRSCATSSLPRPYHPRSLPARHRPYFQGFGTFRFQGKPVTRAPQSRGQNSQHGSDAVLEGAERMRLGTALGQPSSRRGLRAIDLLLLLLLVSGR